MTPKEICNLALLRIGEDIITESADPPNLTGEDSKTVACNALYEPKRDMLLEMFPWRFAMRMISLDVDDQLVTITGATQANPVVITAAGHGFPDYKHVYISDVAGMAELNGNTYRIANVATNTFELEDVDGTAYTAYTSGGTARLRPPFKYEYEHVLPSDFLRDWELYDSTASYEIKEGSLLTNDDEISLEYIAKITDSTKFSFSFINVLYLFMAIDLAQRLGDSKTMVQQITREFGKVLLDSARLNALKGNPPDNRQDDSWQTAGRV